MKCKECVIHVKIVLQSGRNHFTFIYSIEKEIFESHKKISAQTKINLRQTIFHSAEIDFSFGAEKNSVMPKAMSASLRSRAETWLKDEGQFRKTLGREAA